MALTCTVGVYKFEVYAQKDYYEMSSHFGETCIVFEHKETGSYLELLVPTWDILTMENAFFFDTKRELIDECIAFAAEHLLELEKDIDDK